MENKLALIGANEVEQLTAVAQNANMISENVNANYDKIQERFSLFVATLATAEGAKIQEVDKVLDDWQIFLAQQKKVINEGRKPLTAQFDAIKSYFTKIENDFESKNEVLRGNRALLAKTLKDRQVIAEQKRQALIEEQNAKVRFKESIELFFNNQLFSLTKYFINKVQEAFFNKSVEQLKNENLPLNINGFADTLDIAGKLLASFEVYQDNFNILQSEVKKEIANEVFNANKHTYEREAKEAIKTECSRLVDSINHRIAELEQAENSEELARIANERLATEQAKVEAQLSEASAVNENKIASNTAQSELNTALEAVAITSGVESLKGTSEKREYQLTSHEGLASIVSWYFTNIVPTLTLEELNKKFSFMFTSANTDLNSKNGSGVIINSKGLEIVEKIEVRRSRQTNKGN